MSKRRNPALERTACLAACLAALTACSGDEEDAGPAAPRTFCTPYSTLQCTCPGDPTPHVMQCAVDGSGYGACPCAAAPAAGTAGPPIVPPQIDSGTVGGPMALDAAVMVADSGLVVADAATDSGIDAAIDSGFDAGPSAPTVVEFGPNLRLNDDSGRGRQTEVALAAGPDGLVLAGWMDERAQRVCAFSFSTDGGESWSTNVSIPNVSSFVGDPAVAIDGGGTMYALCQQYGANEIRMMTSDDRGQSWSQIRSIQDAPDKPWAQGGVEDGTLFVSWLGSPGGIKRSTDHGDTWEEVQSTGRIIHGTAITTSTTGLVHVPYNLDSSRNQLRYMRSTDNGVTYEEPRDLLPNMGTFCFNCTPRQHPIVGAASDPTGEIVAITWTSTMSGGEGDDDVWLLYSSDGGDTWTEPLRVNDNTTRSRQFESWVAVDRYGRVHVAWTDLRDGQNDTYYARSSDPTQGFEPNVKVNDDAGSANVDFLGDYKGIVVQGNDVLVVWQDTRNDGGDIYFARAENAAGPP